jgi:hypothetical protein
MRPWLYFLQQHIANFFWRSKLCFRTGELTKLLWLASEMILPARCGEVSSPTIP